MTNRAKDLIVTVTLAQDSLAELKAIAEQTLAEHAATLADTVPKADFEAKHAEMKDQSAQRQAWRAEAWAWRRLAGETRTLAPLSVTEVAAKKLEGVSAAPRRKPWEAAPGLAIPQRLESRFAGVQAWLKLMEAGEVRNRLDPASTDEDRGRTLQDYTHALAYNIYWLGHWDSLIALAELWTGLLRGSPDLFLSSNALETSIMAGLLKSSFYVLKQNEGADPRVGAAIAELGAHTKRFDAATAKLPIKALAHAALGEYVALGVDWLLYGRPEDKAKLDHLGGHIAADFDFVTAPDGQEILVMAHGLQGLYRERKGRAQHDFAHWAVYLRTSMSNLEFGALMELPLMTPRVMQAAARTLYWTLPTQGGPSANVYARDMGGGGLWQGAKAQRVVQFRDGTSRPARWKITSFGNTQGVHSFQRGLTYAPAYRAPDLAATWVPELEALDKRATHGRHAIRQALLHIALGGERL